MDSKLRLTKRKNVSIDKKIQRLYSTVAIKEDGIDTKTVVPTHWVNAEESIVYYPPRGKKTVGVYLSEWASPEPGWQEFMLLEFILECGSYETCQAMLNFLTEDENDDRPVSNILNPKERVPSPNLNVLKCTPSGSSSPIQMGVPLISPWKKSKVGCVIQPRPNEDFQRSLDLESYHFNKNPTSFKIGDGGVSFKEMTNKQFQYAMLIKLELLQQNQIKIMERLDNMETQPKSGATDVGVIITIPHKDIKCFNEEEEILRASSSAMKNKITQIKAIGGATARKTVKNVLNQLMVPQVQNLFSKDGLKGKLKFTATEHYKCIKEGLVSERTGYDAATIEALVGDLLKRALPKVKIVNDADVDDDDEEEAT
ncbi:uncharacterized protein LOC136087351 [Hydra vulgaris]|uniref:Uncharacterized protein LOC136087351 n=1 Tax=Hydra vulgaris TaxID=6087 RepID=A0ABM4CVG2_HYDVU